MFVPWTLLRKTLRVWTAVRWILLAALKSVELLPHITDRILAYAQTGAAGGFLQAPIAPNEVEKYLR